MQFTRLGKSGLTVSRLCLGCMSYGDTSKGWHGDWLLDEDAARPFFREALEAGINFFDTANIYSGGTSEEITGKLLREMLKLSSSLKTVYAPSGKTNAHRVIGW